jgi:hypothetical protein
MFVWNVRKWKSILIDASETTKDDVTTLTHVPTKWWRVRYRYRFRAGAKLPYCMILFPFRSALTRIFCLVYCMIFCVFGFVFPICDVLTKSSGEHHLYSEVCQLLNILCSPFWAVFRVVSRDQLSCSCLWNLGSRRSRSIRTGTTSLNMWNEFVLLPPSLADILVSQEFYIFLWISRPRFQWGTGVKTNAKRGADAQLGEKQWMWRHLRPERATTSFQMRHSQGVTLPIALLTSPSSQSCVSAPVSD